MYCSFVSSKLPQSFMLTSDLKESLDGMGEKKAIRAVSLLSMT